MLYVPRFLRFDGYETRDIRENHTDRVVEIQLHRKHDRPFKCWKCATALQAKRGQYRIQLKHLPIMDFACFITLWRWKGHCPKCKKARSEAVDFISKETPHMTKDFTWWLGKLCEISTVSNSAEFYDVSAMTAWRVDFNRMRLMLRYYKIPKVTAISVDEVYARRKGPKGENRNKKFFTVITDLRTHKVIWVSESRDKEALDQFFQIIGPKACKKIRVVATDQHDSYSKSVRENCPNATLVWDRFHLVQNFNEYLNEERRKIFDYSPAKIRGYFRGKYKFIFLKRSSKRTAEEKQHIDEAMEANHMYMKLELIKERFHSFFDQETDIKALEVFDEIGEWIRQAGFQELEVWWNNLEKQWETVKNYFRFRVTTAVSEGINNVIKTLKRKAYGYRNMVYFRLKIMQLCGYLNSKFIPNIDYLLEN